KYGTAKVDYLGLHFIAEEEPLEGIDYLGACPYRVYKNRMKGTRLSLHEKPYNDAITGLEWQYPEFKGYFKDFYWARFNYEETPFTIYNTTPNTFLRLFTPPVPKDARPGVKIPYPAGDISLMHAIPPIGTKFKQPEALGPAGSRHLYAPSSTDLQPYSGRLYFQFW
ncbi:MAG: glycoside hydrolase family 2, partial [Bacteroidota bacterium]